jgi:hypothetical protein
MSPACADDAHDYGTLVSRRMSPPDSSRRLARRGVGGEAPFRVAAPANAPTAHEFSTRMPYAGAKGGNNRKRPRPGELTTAEIPRYDDGRVASGADERWWPAPSGRMAQRGRFPAVDRLDRQ